MLFYQRSGGDLMNISYNSFDYEPTHIIPVIASFTTCGQIIPLYVRINSHSYRVHSYYVKSKFAHRRNFSCQLTCDDKNLIPISLTYYEQEGVWGIPAPQNSS